MRSPACPFSPALCRPELPSWVQDAILGQGAATEGSPWEPEKGPLRASGNLFPLRVLAPTQLALQEKTRGGDAETGEATEGGAKGEGAPKKAGSRKAK